MLQVPDVIVEAGWLYENLDHPKLIILDATIKKVTSSSLNNSVQEYIKNIKLYKIDFDTVYLNSFFLALKHLSTL